MSVWCFAQSNEETDWPAYGNDSGGSRYSAAAQINRTNVGELKVAWTYRTGANDTPTKLIRKAAIRRNDGVFIRMGLEHREASGSFAMLRLRKRVIWRRVIPL